MYHEFFGLREPPFRDTPDPRFAVPIPSHEAAYAALAAGVSAGRGLLLLTGAPGSGKTILVKRLTAALPRSVQVVAVPYPNVTLDDVVWYLAKALDVPAGRDGGEPVRREIARRREHGERVLLVVDEAQALPRATLAALPGLLGGATPDGTPALQILLAGQPALETVANELRLSTSAVRARLEPLSSAESALYIRERLRHGGATSDDLFAPAAVARLGRLAGGTPRLLSVLCDRCLAAAFVAGEQSVTPAIVKQVWASDRTLATTEGLPAPAFPEPARAAPAAPPAPGASRPAPAPVSVAPKTPPRAPAAPRPAPRARRQVDLPFPAPTRTTAAAGGRSLRVAGAGAAVLLGMLIAVVVWRVRAPGPIRVATPVAPPATLAPPPVLVPEERRVAARREPAPDGARPSAAEALDAVDEFRFALESRDRDRLRRVLAPDVAEGDRQGIVAVAARYDRVLLAVDDVAYLQPTATVVPHRERVTVTAPFVIRYQDRRRTSREVAGTAAWDVERRDGRAVIVQIDGELPQALAP